MRRRDGTVTRRELDVLNVVWLAGDRGADLSDETRPALNQVESRVAKRLAYAGLLTIDAGAAAHLTEAAGRFVTSPADNPPATNQ